MTSKEVQKGAGRSWAGIAQDLLAPKEEIPEKRLAKGIPDVDSSKWNAHVKRWARKTKGVLSKRDAHDQEKNDGTGGDFETNT